MAEYVLGQLAADAKDTCDRNPALHAGDQTGCRILRGLPGIGDVLEFGQAFHRGGSAARDLRKDGARQPDGHYQLALAYAGVGRREDANREAALQRQTAEALEAVKRRAATLMEKQQPTPLLRSRSRMSRFLRKPGNSKRLSPTSGEQSSNPPLWPFRVFRRPDLSILRGSLLCQRHYLEAHSWTLA